MTSWKPSFIPNMEVQYNMNVNESGYREGLPSEFNRIIAVIPAIKNISGVPTLDAKLVANWSGGSYDIYLNSSSGIRQTSCDFSAVIFGIE